LPFPARAAKSPDHITDPHPISARQAKRVYDTKGDGTYLVEFKTESGAPRAATAPPSSVMNARRFIGAVLTLGAAQYNAVA